MRWSVWFVLAFAAGCSRELNPDYCQHNPMDVDCRNAGLVSQDAAPPCDPTSCSDSSRPVCDTRYGVCVQCTGADQCQMGWKCGPDDRCHGCVSNSDCSSGLCLGNGNCASSSGDVLYVTPGGTGDCSLASKCTLKSALGLLGANKHVVIMDAGTYVEGPLTVNAAGVFLEGPQVTAKQAPTATIGSAANGAVLTIAGGSIEIDNVAITGSPDAQGIACSNATVALDHVVLAGHGREAIGLATCQLTMEHSHLTTSKGGALVAQNSMVALTNNFVQENGDPGASTGGVSLTGNTSGDIRFNTIAFNVAKAGGGNVSGLRCAQSGHVTVAFNIIAGNSGTQTATNNNCAMVEDFVGTGGAVKFASDNGPYDLHLTSSTPNGSNQQQRIAPDDHPPPPEPRIRDDGNASCDMLDDIDGDVRPQNQACDLGGDELPSSE